VVIATHGRSFYVLDDVAVLRQLTPEVAQSDAHLFQPSDATRTVSRGVAIDYYLKGTPSQIEIQVVDAQGRVVRTFTGTAEDEKKKAETPAGAEEEESPRTAPARVTVKPGMNRFVWDMRYPDATGFPKLIMWAGNLRGPLAVPGKYEVRVSIQGDPNARVVGGLSWSRPFTILKNPNLTNVSDADLQEQFKLATEIRDKLSQANSTVVKIRDLKSQIGDRLGKLDAKRDRTTIAMGQGLVTKLTEVEGEIYQYRNQSSQDPLNYPIKLNNKLAALKGVVESADGRPTEQSYAVFKDLSARLDAELARLEAVQATDLAAFNKLAAAAKLPPVK